jgi:PBP1b-binding outer membrane lipoprotein LpoB
MKKFKYLSVLVLALSVPLYISACGGNKAQKQSYSDKAKNAYSQGKQTVIEKKKVTDM